MSTKMKKVLLFFVVLVIIGIIVIGIAYFRCERVTAQEAVARERRRLDKETQKIYKELEKRKGELEGDIP